MKIIMNMITSWSIIYYVLFMAIDDTKVPFNGIIKR